jgi:hypothetical protein
MKKLLIVGTAVGIAVAAISAANAQSWGRGGAYAGADPSQGYYYYPQVNGHARGCDAFCQRKCERTWVLLGFRSVGACVAKWHRLNAAGTARGCEAAIVASNHRRIKGC